MLPNRLRFSRSNLVDVWVDASEFISLGLRPNRTLLPFFIIINYFIIKLWLRFENMTTVIIIWCVYDDFKDVIDWLWLGERNNMILSYWSSADHKRWNDAYLRYSKNARVCAEHAKHDGDEMGLIKNSKSTEWKNHRFARINMRVVYASRVLRVSPRCVYAFTVCVALFWMEMQF